MTRPELVQIPLAASYLCAEPSCSTIGNDSRQCPRCHSAVLSLARVLERLSETWHETNKEEAAA